MKDELSGMDVYFLVKELQELVGARFQRAYGLGREVYLQLHKSGAGKQLLRTKLPGLMYISTTKPEFPVNPSGFIMSLRKKLGATKVQSIEQLGMDRIIIFTFTKKEEEFKLVFELISPGNVILLGKKPIKGGGLSDEVILNLLSPQKYKDRTVRGGIAYEAPAPAANIKEEGDWAKIAVESEMDNLVKGLAVGLNLGGEYAELVCKRAGLDKKADLNQENVEKALVEIQKLLEETPKPKITDGKIDFFGDGDCESMNEALDKTFSVQEEETETKKKKPRKTLAEIHAEQQKGFEKSAKENQEKAEAIYTHYNELKAMLQEVREGKTPKSKLFKKFDKKTGTLTVEC